MAVKIDLEKTDRLFVEHGMAIRDILEQAVIRALIEHKRAGNPIAAWENGRVVIIQPEDIQIPDAGMTTATDAHERAED